MEPRIDPPDTTLEDNMADRVADMTDDQVLAALECRRPGTVNDLRTMLEDILIDEWRYRE